MKAYHAAIIVLAATCAASWSPTPLLAAPEPAKTAKEKKDKKLTKEQLAEEFLTNGPHPDIYINADPTELRRLNDRPKEYIRVNVREVIKGQPDNVYVDVGMHLKGGPGSFRRVEDRPALTLNFDKFDEDLHYHGLDKVHLNNSVQDPTYMLENLTGWIFREAGVPVTRASNCRVWLNGRSLGLFVIKEGHDGVFYKTYFKDKTGNLYEGSFREAEGDMPVDLGLKPEIPPGPLTKDSQKILEQETRDAIKRAHVKLKEMSDACRDPDLAKRKERLDKVLDVDKFYTFMACESLLAHWDGYGGNRNNYRIYDNPKTGKLTFLAHGMDQTLQRPDYALVGSNGAMVCQALLATPEDKQRYYDRVAEIRKTVFTPERLTAQLEEISTRLAPLMADTSKDAERQHREMTAQVRQRLLERIPHVDRQLGNPPKPLKFENNVAELAKMTWEPKLQEGNAIVDKADESGRPRFRVKLEKEAGNGSWRLPLLLAPGRYVFEGQMKLAGVVAATNFPTGGAGIRISGEKAPFRMKGDVNWQDVRYEFEVTEPLKEVVLVCDLNGKAGQAMFDVGSLKLRKK